MLTPNMHKLLSYIQAYQAVHGGVAPTVAEMAEGLGVASTSHAHRVLVKLEQRGFVRRIPREARAIEVLKRAKPAREMEGA